MNTALTTRNEARPRHIACGLLEGLVASSIAHEFLTPLIRSVQWRTPSHAKLFSNTQWRSGCERLRHTRSDSRFPPSSLLEHGVESIYWIVLMIFAAAISISNYAIYMATVRLHDLRLWTILGLGNGR